VMTISKLRAGGEHERLHDENLIVGDVNGQLQTRDCINKKKAASD